MDEESGIRRYKDRFRILLILYYFSDDYTDPENALYKKIFKSELRIQKIDFLIRNPDYLAYELLSIAKKNDSKRPEIKRIVQEILKSKEPILRRLEMERFFFGAYEDIDDVIGFLKSVGFIDFTSKKATNLTVRDKKYFITTTALEKINNSIPKLPALDWYLSRCELIKHYFGNLSGTELKVAQYQINEYRETTYKSYIGSIQNLVQEEFNEIYKEIL
jgi:hypothetical protein